MIFETLGDLTRCLEAVLADGDAVVVRVKNRYAPDYDADESAGYRRARLPGRCPPLRETGPWRLPASAS